MYLQSLFRICNILKLNRFLLFCFLATRLLNITNVILCFWHCFWCKNIVNLCKETYINRYNKKISPKKHCLEQNRNL